MNKEKQEIVKALNEDKKYNRSQNFVEYSSITLVADGTYFFTAEQG